MTIRENGFWKYFLNTMVMTEYKLLQYVKDGYLIYFENNNKDIIGDNGKVIKRPVNDTVVEYNIIVVKDDDIDFKTFKSVVPGENNILENYEGGFYS
jgi:hypothetical protein